MKRCHFNKELSAYLDGELAQKEIEALEEHLKTCVDCRMELSQLERVSRSLKEWHAPELGAFFSREVMPQGQGKGRAKMEKKRLFILVPSGVLAAVLLLMFVGNMHRGVQYRALAGKMKAEVGGAYSPSAHRYAYNSGGQIENAVKLAKGDMRSERSGSEVVMGFSGSPQYEPQYAKGVLYDRDFASTSSAEPEGYGMYAASSAPATVEDNGQVLIVAPLMPVIGEGEKVIRTASVLLEVENGKETYKNVEAICVEYKGHITSSAFYRKFNGLETGKLVMRVPKDSLSAVLDKINALGKVEDVSIDTKDVSEEYTEFSAQLQTAKLVYDKALEALKKRQPSVSDALKTESELTPILLRIESLKNSLERLNNDIAYATITMEFHEAELSNKALKESTKDIKDSFIKAKIEMVKFLAGAVAMLPTLILILVISLAVIVFAVIVYAVIKKGVQK